MAKGPKDPETRMLLDEYKALVLRRRLHERRVEQIKRRATELKRRIRDLQVGQDVPSSGEF